MASNIVPGNIDGAYPKAGQDNSSQGFRDNFSAIKDNFTEAKNDIEAKYNITDNMRTYTINHIQHYKPGGGYPALHYERGSDVPKRILAYMLYLNTVTDKGGTEFPYQNVSLSAIKGDFPSSILLNTILVISMIG